jgi:hypothetical protein
MGCRAQAGRTVDWLYQAAMAAAFRRPGLDTSNRRDQVSLPAFEIPAVSRPVEAASSSKNAAELLQ